MLGWMLLVLVQVPPTGGGESARPPLVHGTLTLRGSAVVEQRDADRARIRAHLQRVERELRARDVSGWPQERRASRSLNLDRLRRYWQRGEFPVRHASAPGTRRPEFIDAEGTACAVGHLVIASGHGGVAEAIRRDQNDAFLEDIAHSELPDWIAQSGLTAAECARIQPSYCSCGTEFVPVCGVDGVSYGNRCVAEVCAGVEVAAEGECVGETSDAWPPAGTESGSGGAGDSGLEPADADERAGCSVVPRGGGMLALLVPLVVACSRRRYRP